MKLLTIFMILFVGLTLISQEPTMTAQVPTQPKISNTVEKKFDEKVNTISEKLDNIQPAKKQVKIIYRNRTKIVQRKPKEITLYVRHIDSTITEHKVIADGGFYIVNEADIAPTKDEIKVEIKDDTIIKKTNFWKKLWNRN